MKKIFILRENQRETIEFDWGSLIWHASKKLKNSIETEEIVEIEYQEI
jgi:hypothetical protein